MAMIRKLGMHFYVYVYAALYSNKVCSSVGPVVMSDITCWYIHCTGGDSPELSQAESFVGLMCLQL